MSFSQSRWGPIALLLVLALSLDGCALPLKQMEFSPIEGRVLDEQTGAPVQDAVVYVHWQEGRESLMERYPGPSLFVAETTTDEHGRFRLPGGGPVNSALGKHLTPNAPTVGIVKSGYRPYVTDLGHVTSYGFPDRQLFHPFRSPCCTFELEELPARNAIKEKFLTPTGLMSSDLAWVAQTGCWWEHISRTIYELDSIAEWARQVGITPSLFVSEDIPANPNCKDPRTYFGKDREWAKAQASVLPRLASSPTLGKTELSAAAGGSVRVTFDINGQLGNVAEVVLAITSDEGDPFPTTAGLVRLPSPMQTHNSVEFPVAAQTRPGGYHLWVTLIAERPQKSRSTYYVDVTANTQSYTCSQNVGSTVSMLNPTSFVVPRLEIR